MCTKQEQYMFRFKTTSHSPQCLSTPTILFSPQQTYIDFVSDDLPSAQKVLNASYLSAGMRFHPHPGYMYLSQTDKQLEAFTAYAFFLRQANACFAQCLLKINVFTNPLRTTSTSLIAWRITSLCIWKCMPFGSSSSSRVPLCEDWISHNHNTAT